MPSPAEWRAKAAEADERAEFYKSIRADASYQQATELARLYRERATYLESEERK